MLNRMYLLVSKYYVYFRYQWEKLNVSIQYKSCVLFSTKIDMA